MRIFSRRTSVGIIWATMALIDAGATVSSSFVAFGQAPGSIDPSVEPIPTIEVFDSAQSISTRVLFNTPTDVGLLSAGVSNLPPPALIGGPPLIRVVVFDVNWNLLVEFNEWHPLLVEHEGANGGLDTFVEESGEGCFLFPFAPNVGKVMITDIELGQELIEIDANHIEVDYCAANDSDSACELVPPTPVGIDIKPGSDTNSLSILHHRLS